MLSLLLLAACDDPAPVDSGEPSDTADSGDSGEPSTDEPDCAEAEARLGYRACVPRVPDEDTFTSITVASSSIDQLRTGKYLVPATYDARVPPVFLDVNSFTLHYDFLVQAFPDEFSGLTTLEYQSLTLDPDTREFYAGSVSLYLDDDGVYYGFTVWDDPADDTTTVTQAQVTEAWEILQERFEAGTLVWVPNSESQQTAALDWSDTPFEIRNPAEVLYEAYNEGEAYGYLRLYTLDEFVTATEQATFGYQDIVVIEEAPEDLERVVSGIVTGTRQGTLSHLNVRSASRGTPNCYISGPLLELASWEDQLVHFECGSSDYDVETATAEDAQAWWDEIRPDPVVICPPDLDVSDMPGLLELDTSTAEVRQQNVCTWGAKGSNLGTLYQLIDEELQLDGFVVPFSYYRDFVETGTWEVDLGSGTATYTFQETLDAWHADETFLTDASVRRDRLDALRAAMDESPPDPAAVAAISARILEVWGTDDIAVRFRSSSNAEDGVGFSGAGLYESRTACLADELDGDDDGPSLCDPDQEDERSISEALQYVWASTWKVSAWEEREWYGITQSDVAMGMLVDTRSKDEQANIVAFSGNPSSDGDDRYLVNSQEGDLEVVSAEPGIYPEKTLLTVDADGVSQIDRVSASSETDEVLSDEELTALGEAFWEIVQVFPQDDEIPEGSDLMWDTEWKILEDGRLIVKQIRPYLR